jgi:tripartite-type tricarboxylate transporter receptor subunit TctC
MPDLMSGRIAMVIDGVPVQTPNIRNGKVKGLAVTTSKRSPALPEIPTMKESGLDYEVPFWTAVYAPIKTPAPIIEKLGLAFAKAMRDEAVVKQLAEVGTESVGSTPRELDALTRQQYHFYRQIVENNKELLQ